MNKLDSFVSAYGSNAMFTLRTLVGISSNPQLSSEDRSAVDAIIDEMCERYATAIAEYQDYCRRLTSTR